ncbi:hypothetical protein [Nocardioides alkalitolerans]|uniref:hypothetical protein n=1 Tax=Nocardioides alkalitolerans TaxID=281714 RepID=UPI0004145854|nr:hypothetical protein [Nocardioides alkalitolerans]
MGAGYPYDDMGERSYSVRELDDLGDRRADEAERRRDTANDDAADRDAIRAARRRDVGVDPGAGSW